MMIGDYEILYQGATPFKGHPPQRLGANLVVQTLPSGVRLKVELKFDTSYRDQSNAELYVLDGKEFRPLLSLEWYEIPLVKNYYDDKDSRSTKPYGLDVRHLHQATMDLAKLAYKIVGQL